jgi:hypothetical protein
VNFMHASRSLTALATAVFFAGLVPAAVLAQGYPVTTAPAGTMAPATTAPATKVPTGLPPVQTMAPMQKATPGSATGGAMSGGTAGTIAPLAHDARALRGKRTATGYTLTGQALVNDACQAARFDPSLLTIFPPQFNLVQFRRPGTMGLLCAMRLTWVTATPRAVTSQHPPAYITVRTQARTYRVPIR